MSFGHSHWHNRQRLQMSSHWPDLNKTKGSCKLRVDAGGED